MKIDEKGRGIEQDHKSNNRNGDHNNKDVDDADNNRWRELCRMVAEEKNPARMSTLLDELITALDKRRQNFREDGPADGDLGSGINLLPETEES
jgi:hypothetical protein